MKTAPIRLQKFLADAGIASRRSAEKIIAEGRVEVNGRKVTITGSKIDPAVDRVKFDNGRTGFVAAKATPLWFGARELTTDGWGLHEYSSASNGARCETDHPSHSLNGSSPGRGRKQPT